MKNIHVLPTDKPSRFTFIKYYSYYRFRKDEFINNDTHQNQNIYITTDEDIKEGDWIIDLVRNEISKANGLSNGDSYLVLDSDSFTTTNQCRKIILTTDQDLIKDGIQPIDDEFLEWFVKNPSCEKVKVRKNPKVNFIVKGKGVQNFNQGYKIIIPKEEPKQELEEELFELEQELDIPSSMRWHNSKPNQEPLEEAAHRILTQYGIKSIGQSIGVIKVQELMVEMAKWQQERMYSEKEVIDLLVEMNSWPTTFEGKEDITEWFNQFKNK